MIYFFLTMLYRLMAERTKLAILIGIAIHKRIIKTVLIIIIDIELRLCYDKNRGRVIPPDLIP